MSKKIRFIDPKRTKELQESMKDHGRASTYWGLIILIFFIVAFILSYYFQIRWERKINIQLKKKI